MTRRLLPLMLVLALFFCGLAGAEDPIPGAKGESKSEDPPRLKRKKRDGVPPVQPGVKEDQPKLPAKEKGMEEGPLPKPVPGKGEIKGKGKDEGPIVPKGKGDEPIVPEDGGGPVRPGDPEEDESEILERLNRNMRAVEEKLGNRELGEPTTQQQRDILKDLDALIHRTEQQQQGGGGGGGGGGENQPQPEQGGGGGGGGEKDKQQARQQQQKGGGQGQGQGQGQAQGQKQGQGQGQGQRSLTRGGSKRQPRNQSQRAGGRQKGNQVAKGNQQGGNQPKEGQGKEGNNPGMGGGGPQNPNPLDDKVTRDIWGHLPESLRAEMNAYSNPQPFLPRYDRVIREYYKTIASQGRKKGD